MRFDGKIPAIKAVRDLGSRVEIVKDENTGKFVIQPNMGLKDAKDLVEAIMDLGVRMFILNGTTPDFRKDLSAIDLQNRNACGRSIPNDEI